MTPRLGIRGLAAAITLLCTALPALAGSVMVTETKDGNRTYINEARVQGANVRVDNNDGERSSFILAGSTILIVNHTARTYQVLDEGTLRRIGERMAGARRQMEARMAQLPPEQRAMMQQMMGRAGGAGAAAAPRTQYRRTARTETAAGIACTVWEGMDAGKKTSEVCVAPTARVPGGAELLAAMKQLGERMKSMTASMGINAHGMLQQGWNQLDALAGIPIIQRSFEGGRVTSSSVLKSMRPMAVPPATFAAPAGYRRETMNLGQ